MNENYLIGIYCNENYIIKGNIYFNYNLILAEILLRFKNIIFYDIINKLNVS